MPIYAFIVLCVAGGLFLADAIVHRVFVMLAFTLAVTGAILWGLGVGHVWHP